MRYTESIPDFRFLEESIQWVGQKLVSPEFMVVLPLTSEIRSTFIGHLDSHFRTFFDLEHISFVCLFVCFALSGFLSYFEGSSINDITNTLINTWAHYLFTLLPFKRWRHIWMTLKFRNIKFFRVFFWWRICNYYKLFCSRKIMTLQNNSSFETLMIHFWEIFSLQAFIFHFNSHAAPFSIIFFVSDGYFFNLRKTFFKILIFFLL